MQLRQAGAPPARVPQRARSAVARRARVVRRRRLPGPRRGRREGLVTVPDRRRRARRADAEGDGRAGRRHAHLVHRPEDAGRAHRPDDQRGRRCGRPAGAAGHRGAAGVRHRRRRRARERAAKVFAIYGQLPSYRAMLDREGAAGPPTSPSSAPPTRSPSRCCALGEIGVTDFAAVRVRRRPRRGGGDASGARRSPQPLDEVADRRRSPERCSSPRACSAGPGVRTDRAAQPIGIARRRPVAPASTLDVVVVSRSSPPS